MIPNVIFLVVEWSYINCKFYSNFIYRLTRKYLFEGDTKSEIYENNKLYNKAQYNFGYIHYYFQNLLSQMLEDNPVNRITAKEALKILD